MNRWEKSIRNSLKNYIIYSHSSLSATCLEIRAPPGWHTNQFLNIPMRMATLLLAHLVSMYLINTMQRGTWVVRLLTWTRCYSLPAKSVSLVSLNSELFFQSWWAEKKTVLLKKYAVILHRNSVRTLCCNSVRTSPWFLKSQPKKTQFKNIFAFFFFLQKIQVKFFATLSKVCYTKNHEINFSWMQCQTESYLSISSFNQVALLLSQKDNYVDNCNFLVAKKLRATFTSQRL